MNQQATVATTAELAIVHAKRRAAIELLDRQHANVRKALAAVVIANIRKTTKVTQNDLK